MYRQLKKEIMYNTHGTVNPFHVLPKKPKRKNSDFYKGRDILT